VNLPKTNRWRWQRGIALILALMVMSLATMTAVSLSSDQQLFFRRTENLLYHEQAYQYLLGAEDWGKQVLARDFTANKIDSKKDDWATILPPIPVEGGTVGGTIEDLQGRFNINNLADPKDTASLEAFRELLSINKIPPDLANAVLDWLDTDQNARFPDGAEDVDYTQGERAYRAANGLMGSVSELLYIKGFTYPMYEALAPALIALPSSGIPVNVNTATPLVLRMLSKGLSEQDAEKLADDLAKNPVSDIKDFLSNNLLTGKPVATNGIDVRSSYFMIHSFSNIGRVKAHMDSLIHRVSASNVKTLQRSQGGV
jgi:general secretion pathway protein K